MSFLMMGRDMRAMVPTELLFWGVMSLGVIAGFASAYPSNVWLVARRLKHGLMTERTRGSRFDLEKRHGASAQTDGTHSEHADHVPHLGGGEHATGSHHVMESDATPAQRTALAAVSFLMLVAGMVAPANWVNLRLSARDVGGAIMPPGMIMDRNTPAEAMLDMAAVDPRDVVARLGLEARGRS
jgi:hypothetical protein